MPFVNDQQTARFPDGIDDGSRIQRRNGAQVDQFDGDTLFGELHRGLFAFQGHEGTGHDGDVRAFGDYAGLTERDQFVGFRSGQIIELHVVHGFVFKDQYGVIITDRAFEESLGFPCGGGQGDLEPGAIGYPCMQALGMLCGKGSPATHGGPDHQRHVDLPAGHIVDFGGLIANLIHADQQEIRVHDFDYGAHSHNSRSHAGSHDARFGNRRILAPHIAVLVP